MTHLAQSSMLFVIKNEILNDESKYIDTDSHSDYRFAELMIEKFIE